MSDIDLRDFQCVNSATVDSRGRVTVLKTAVTPGARLGVWAHPDGAVLLLPLEQQPPKKAK